MERQRSLHRCFSIKPTRFLLLSSTIFSSLLFCFYYSFWLLDSTTSAPSAAYFQLIGGSKVVKADPFFASNDNFLANRTGNPIAAETLVAAVGNPPSETSLVGDEEKDGIADAVRVREAFDSSPRGFDSFGNGTSPISSDMPSNATTASGDEVKGEILDDNQVTEAGDISVEEIGLIGNRANFTSSEVLLNATDASGGNQNLFEYKNNSEVSDVSLTRRSDLSDEVLQDADAVVERENSDFDAEEMEKEEIEVDSVADKIEHEDDSVITNSSSYTSFDQSKSSLMENTETDGGTIKCDISDGRWLFDESYPLYPSNSCPFVDEGFSCEANGRVDKDYMKWRWQPNGCSIPRFNPVKMLELIRGKRLVFVGDSINRNQWESMLCMLRTALSDPSRVYEAHGKRITKNRGNYKFKFPDYDCSVEYYVTHHLVRESKARIGQRRVSTLRIDAIDRGSSRWRGADILVFNTAHWWSHHKTKAGVNYYQEGNLIHQRLDVSTAFSKALLTWARWVDQHVNPSKTVTFFRSSAPSHFSGGGWNSGGHCKESIYPLNDTYVRQVPEKNVILEQVVRRMKTPVTILNITTLSGLRIDGHPSVYGRAPGSGPATRIQDCSHWCLPGVPDTWNDNIGLSGLHAADLMDNSMRRWRSAAIRDAQEACVRSMAHDVSLVFLH